ncbi:T9SS C-terminal target domain-containing protein [Chryseobacterium sp. G0186]|uniref:T9SS type A sorting domain-containing protein n=1 Tax=Chryseobacterium sp. G0186 TaxID=2487064 RepID=UPI000F4E6BE1|nr:T9SS type A sorting domain-containing protein [Chryseobacterium sp. G0186]AZA76736.1 T9SS C-terminal target domain-containing protein [Chryseobacterium sp. G0186]
MIRILYLSVFLGLYSLNAQTTIFNQTVTSNNGIVADALANGNFVASADDFTLANQSRITKIKVIGFQNAESLETIVATGVMLYIYADAAGSPAGIPNGAGTPIATMNIAKGAPGYSLVKTLSGYTFEIDVTAAISTPVVLSANTTYWVVFAAKTNQTSYGVNNGDNIFNWFSGQINGNAAKLVDPTDAFGAGATTWTSISLLTGDSTFDGLAFSIEGQNDILGTQEVFSNVKKMTISPNPTTDYLNINSVEKINKAEVFDMGGRKVDVNIVDNRVDVKSLSAGSYIINIETKAGKTTEKFIKK